MLTKRFAGNLIYAVSMTLIIVMRILVSVGLFTGLDDTVTDLIWSGAVQCVILGLIPFLLYFLYLKKLGCVSPLKQIANDFGYNRFPSLKGWVLIFLISLISCYVITCVSTAWYNFISLLGYKPKITSNDPYTLNTLLISILTTAVLPPLFEEFSNRGVLFYTHDVNKSPFKVIIITATMFALMHTNITQVIYTFVFGMVAGALVYTTKSIWPAVVYHFVNNFVSVMNTYGNRNENGFNVFNNVYDFLFGTTGGVILASILFIFCVIILSWLIFELSSVETLQREKKKVNLDKSRYEFDTVAVKKKYDDFPLYYAVVLNVVVTIFTLVWGIIR